MSEFLVGEASVGLTDRADGFAFARKFTVEVTGLLTQIRFYSRKAGYVKAAVYADNGGSPGNRLAKQDAAQECIADQFNFVDLESAIPVTLGQIVWLCGNCSADGVISSYIDTGGIDEYYVSNFAGHTWPETWPGGTPYYRRLCFAGFGDVLASPIAETNPANEITYSTAKLHGKVTDDGGSECKGKFAYGVKPTADQATAWTEGLFTNDTFEAAIDTLLSETTYVFKAIVENAQGDDEGDELEFTTLQAPPPPKKALITHPGIKRVRIIVDGEIKGDYDKLSDLDAGYLENALELPIPTPSIVEVETIAGQVHTYTIT
jgi:hypothetical protein